MWEINPKNRCRHPRDVQNNGKVFIQNPLHPEQNHIQREAYDLPYSCHLHVKYKMGICIGI